MSATSASVQYGEKPITLKAGCHKLKEQAVYSRNYMNNQSIKCEKQILIMVPVTGSPHGRNTNQHRTCQTGPGHIMLGHAALGDLLVIFHFLFFFINVFHLRSCQQFGKMGQSSSKSHNHSHNHHHNHHHQHHCQHHYPPHNITIIIFIIMFTFSSS